MRKVELEIIKIGRRGGARTMRRLSAKANRKGSTIGILPAGFAVRFVSSSVCESRVYIYIEKVRVVHLG